MASTPCLTGERKPPPSPIAAGNGDGQSPARPQQWALAANSFHHRFDRATIGFWVGWVLSAAGGCLFAASMTHQYPGGAVISVLWWGIYCGCTGASISALVCWLTERTPASPPQGPEGAGKPPSGAVGPALPAGPSGSLSGANRR